MGGTIIDEIDIDYNAINVRLVGSPDRPVMAQLGPFNASRQV